MDGEEVLSYVGVTDPELVVLGGPYARGCVDPFCDLGYDTLDGGGAGGDGGRPLFVDGRQRVRADSSGWRGLRLWLLFLTVLLLWRGGWAYW